MFSTYSTFCHSFCSVARTVSSSSSAKSPAAEYHFNFGLPSVWFEEWCLRACLKWLPIISIFITIKSELQCLTSEATYRIITANFCWRYFSEKTILKRLNFKLEPGSYFVKLDACMGQTIDWWLSFLSSYWNRRKGSRLIDDDLIESRLVRTFTCIFFVDWLRTLPGY